VEEHKALVESAYKVLGNARFEGDFVNEVRCVMNEEQLISSQETSTAILVRRIHECNCKSQHSAVRRYAKQECSATWGHCALYSTTTGLWNGENIN